MAIRQPGFLIRLTATLIDLIIIFSILLLIVTVLKYAGIYVPFELTFIISFMLYSSLLIGWKGRTAGKALAGLRVESSTEGTIGYSRSIFREILCKVISAVFLFTGFFWVAFSRKKKGWHDYLAGTTVVQEIGAVRRAKAIQLIVLGLLGVLICYRLVMIGLIYLDAVQIDIPQGVTTSYSSNDPSSLVEISSLGKSDYSVFTGWLDNNGLDPVDYAVETAAKYQVTIFGEHHFERENLLFLNKIIPELYHRAGVTCVAMETYAAENNDRLERLVTADKFDRDLALKIARANSWPDWGAKEYWDVMETVWRLNKNLPRDQRKMRLIGIDIKLDLPTLALVGTGDDAAHSPMWEKLRFFRLFNEILPMVKRDEIMARNVEKEIIAKGERAIVWVGAAHAYTTYRRPIVIDGNVLRELTRMGFMLHQKYGDKVFLIRLHDRPIESIAITTFIERIIIERGGKPSGFDLMGSPFGLLRDKDSDYFRHKLEICFSDMVPGYVFLKPLDEQKRCQWVKGFITQEMFAKYKPYFEAECGHKLNGAEDANNAYQEKYSLPIS